MGNVVPGRRPPPPRSFTNDSWCLCRVNGILTTTRQPLNVTLHSSDSPYPLPAGALVMYGGQSTLASAISDSFDTAIINLPEACASVDGGQHWLRLASAPLSIDPEDAQPLTLSCYDPARGIAYMLPNSVPDPSNSPLQQNDVTPFALLSRDFSSWQKVYFPEDMQRRDANCFVDTQLELVTVMMLNGAGWVNQRGSGNDSCPLPYIEFTYKDRLYWDSEDGSYLETDLYAPLFTPRVGALLASHHNHSVYEVDVSYVLGGSGVSARSTLNEGCVVGEESDLYDMWFSVDRAHWFRSIVSFPFQQATDSNLGLNGNGLQGAVLTASPSGTLVLLARNQHVGELSMMASMDGGFAWAVCAVDVGFSQRDKPTVGWWQVGGKERLVVVGGVSPVSNNVTAEVWVSNVDFSDIAAVTSLCRLPRPADDRIGLSNELLSRIIQSVGGSGKGVDKTDIRSTQSSARMWSQAKLSQVAKRWKAEGQRKPID